MFVFDFDWFLIEGFLLLDQSINRGLREMSLILKVGKPALVTSLQNVKAQDQDRPVYNSRKKEEVRL